jgi:hypothetical protein
MTSPIFFQIKIDWKSNTPNDFTKFNKVDKYHLSEDKQRLFLHDLEENADVVIILQNIFCFSIKGMKK